MVFDADGGVKEEAVPEGKGEPVLTDKRALVTQQERSRRSSQIILKILSGLSSMTRSTSCNHVHMDLRGLRSKSENRIVVADA